MRLDLHVLPVAPVMNICVLVDVIMGKGGTRDHDHGRFEPVSFT